VLRRLIVPVTVAAVLVLAQLAYALVGGVGLVAHHDPVAVAAVAQENTAVVAARVVGNLGPSGVPTTSGPGTPTDTAAPTEEGQVFTCGRIIGSAADHPTNAAGATLLGSNPETYCPVTAGTAISQEFGTKSSTSPYGHSGMDFNGNSGDPIFAASEGLVVYSTYNGGGYGNLVGIQRPDGVLFWYAHLTKRLVDDGAWITAGQKIGTMGDSGASEGSHLHFEVAVGKGREGKYGVPTDPRDLLFGKPSGTHIGWATSPPKWSCDHYGGC
jgi:murein DD-endopeptidase MepM/ murein hydrolase activator NlpD